MIFWPVPATSIDPSEHRVVVHLPTVMERCGDHPRSGRPHRRVRLLVLRSLLENVVVPGAMRQ